jgi:diguanylate cyclase (GGDEF)-like protein
MSFLSGKLQERPENRVDFADPPGEAQDARQFFTQIISKQRQATFSPMVMLVVTPLIFVIITSQIGDNFYRFMSFVLLAIGTSSLLLTLFFNNPESAAKNLPLDLKNKTTGFLILIYAIPNGLYVYYGVTFIDNASVHMALVASMTIYCASTVQHNAGRAFIVPSVLLCTQGAMSVALLQHPEPIYKILGVLAALSVLAILESASAARRMIAGASQSGAKSRELAAKLEAALDGVYGGVAMFDRDGRIVAANPLFASMFGTGGSSKGAAVDASALASGAVRAGVLAPGEAARLTGGVEAALSAGGPVGLDLPTLQGKVLHLSFQPNRDRACVVLVTDVTQERARALETLHQATHDCLTGLPNRWSFEDRLKSAMRGAVDGDLDYALLSLEFYGFQRVNDTLGRPLGDNLLIQVAERLRQIVGPKDFLARFGADAFMILHEANGPRTHAALADRAISALSTPFVVEEREALVGVNLGVALAPEDAEDAYDLLRNADFALRAAKAAGPGLWRSYEPSQKWRAGERREIGRDLRRALSRRQFSLVYQPVVDLLTLDVIGCEALLRWKHPVRGAVPAEIFVAIAEETGQTAEIGRWALGQACADAMTWPIPAKVSINISAAQIAGDATAEAVRSALAASGLPPQRLDLEIAESTLLSESEAAVKLLRECRGMGVSTSLDEFGSRHASFKSLSNFSFDRIKLDPSLIAKMATSGTDAAIVAAIAACARRLDLAVVAEGVVTVHQIRELIQSGIRLGQGPHFARPQPLESIPWRLGGLRRSAVGAA